MIEKTVTIINSAGLHARAASKLASLTATFSSKIEIGHNGKMVDGKSILSLMMLAATQGTELRIVVNGNDEELAMSAISAMINNKFGEDS